MDYFTILIGVAAVVFILFLVCKGLTLYNGVGDKIFFFIISVVAIGTVVIAVGGA
jgi:hypothetical protein